MSVIDVSYQLHKNPFSMYEHSNPDSESVCVCGREMSPAFKKHHFQVLSESKATISNTQVLTLLSLSLCISS